ncbi:MAG: hypothetical protein ACPGWR_22220 [Ardenticatenaceae bacterium]
MSNNRNGYLVDKKRISQLADDLLIRYQDMQDERSQLHQWEWENDFDFTILGLIELCDSDVGGYASQIATKGSVINPKGALKVLSEIGLFNDPDFVAWYFSADKVRITENSYPKVKMYANLLDYLRMLVMDYVADYQLGVESAGDEMASSLSSFSIPSEEQVDALQAVPA